jgi:mannose-6-phosphate isomerase-like protein (cupin superfamily)
MATILTPRIVSAGLALVLGAAALTVSSSSMADPATHERPSGLPIYAHLNGTVALENDRVLVQRFVIPPGRWTGDRTYSGRQLLVFVKGGVLTSKSGRSTLWPDGRVVWVQDAGHDQDTLNSGSTPIELLWVTLKPVIPGPAAATAGQEPKFGYLNYPNIPGEDVLENDRVIVQRFKMKPGDWEGIHAHNPNTFYIFIKGGHWLSKSKEHPQGVPGSAKDGTVAWMDAIDLSDEHQSGNVGTNPTEVVWVSLKE